MPAAEKNLSGDNQGRVCDAVVRVLEDHTGQSRSDISRPEKAGGPGGVDLLFRLGPDQYALEHTKIEPFKKQIRHDVHFSEFITPVMEQLGHGMPKPGVYDLIFPVDTRLNANAEEIDTLRTALIHWAHENAGILHAKHPHRLSRDECPRGIRETQTGRPEGFPFDVTLAHRVYWAESGVHDGTLRPLRIAPDDIEARRRERIQAAIEKKRAKLRYRKAEGARTVLVLENNDMILTNHALVGDHLAAVLPDRPEWLDDLFYADTAVSTWMLCKWSWDDGWWEDGYLDFEPDGLDNVCV